MNAASYVQWAREQGVTVISGREVQRQGMEACIAEALQIAGDGTDVIYLSVDIDCLAFPWAIGTSATSPEGLSAWQLMEAVFACGSNPRWARWIWSRSTPARTSRISPAAPGAR